MKDMFMGLKVYPSKKIKNTLCSAGMEKVWNNIRVSMTEF